MQKITETRIIPGIQQDSVLSPPLFPDFVNIVPRVTLLADDTETFPYESHMVFS